MNAKAVTQTSGRLGRSAFGLALSMLVVGLVSFAFAGSAGAAPVVGKDGQLHACYVVKGKPKGAMRVLPAGKKCRRGERKLSWGITGPAGPRGADGSAGGQGAAGSNGAPGVDGASGSAGADVAGLETSIASLTLKVGVLEGLLQGVHAGDLSGALGKLSGLTGAQLNEAVGALPAVALLCTQASGLTTQVNLLRGVLGGLSLNSVLTVLGGLLEIPVLPASLPAFTCPS